MDSFDPGRGMPVLLGAGMPDLCGDMGRPGEACRAPLPGVRGLRLVNPDTLGGDSRDN